MTAIDNQSSNLNSLKKNLRNNGIGNVRVIKADLSRYLLPDSDLILVDPPRSGLGPKIIHALCREPGRRILYFSCDSATFSRDLARLRNYGYRPGDLAIIDNFPQTDHFEIFCCLEKNR